MWLEYSLVGVAVAISLVWLGLRLFRFFAGRTRCSCGSGAKQCPAGRFEAILGRDPTLIQQAHGPDSRT